MDWMLKEKVPQGFDIEGLKTNPEGSIWVDQYASERLDLPPMPLPGIKLFNMRKLMALHLYLIFVSLLVLLFERTWYRVEQLLL